MKQWMKYFLLLSIAVMVGLSVGCRGRISTDLLHIQLGDAVNYQESDWRIMKLPMKDGRHLSLEVPFKLEPNEPEVENEEVTDWNVYEHNEDRIWVSVARGVFSDSDSRVKFDEDTFVWNLKGSPDTNPEVKTLEKRTINGQEVTYAEVEILDDKDVLYRAECLGIDMGSKFWILQYIYKEKDKDMKKVAERSIASVRIE